MSPAGECVDGAESDASGRRVRALCARFERLRQAVDRGLYALFSRHADRTRHERDRRHYRGAAVGVAFDLYVARTYAASWVVFALAGAAVAGAVLALPATVLGAVAGFLAAGLPVDLSAIGRPQAAVASGGVGGLLAKRATVWLGGRYLKWTAHARRVDIERTLPGAVRYLRALAAGADDGRGMLRTVAGRGAYGETARSFQRVLARAELTGSLDSGLRLVARDTPSRDLLSPFLLKFSEHAQQGEDALANYLRLESRMLSHRQARARQRAQAFLELLAEVFIVLLVLPSLLVLVVTVMAVLAPGLGAPVSTPLGTVTVRAVIVYGAVAFVLVVGAAAAGLVERVRPPDQAPPSYERPGGLATLRTSLSNPASAALVVLPAGIAVAGALAATGVGPANVALLTYAAYGLPVGTVAVRRARRDDAKDRELKDFVHAVAGHVSLGRPFGEAVARVARDVDLGPLQSDVDDLAFNLGLTTGVDGEVRADALERFVDRVGTPLAGQTIGLVTGALDVGSDAEDVFDTLQTEVGRLYHERKALKSAMMVYVAVGWTTALLVVGITVAANQYVLDGFAQLTAVGDAAAGVALNPGAVDPARDRYRFYLVTQATMLACGWFAGAANRGVYDALLHSAALVAVAYLTFAGVGMV
jgi:archaellum biogenesis protein FlaJ (TadC family)